MGEAGWVPKVEQAATEIAKWYVALVDEAVSALMPSGRPYGMEKLTEQEEVDLYVRNLRGQTDKWAAWMMERVGTITGRLQGMPPEVVATIHPFDIVRNAAIVYSDIIEKKLSKLSDKMTPSSDAPFVSPPSDEGAEWPIQTAI